MATGFLSHIDFSVGDIAKSIPFYDAFLTAIGYLRRHRDGDDYLQDRNITRATWEIRYPDGSVFEIELRPAEKLRRYERYEPGPHHIAFSACDDHAVYRVYQSMLEVGAEVLDPPAEYGGRDGYGDHYYAVFVADPDGVKLEVCCTTAPRR